MRKRVRAYRNIAVGQSQLAYFGIVERARAYILHAVRKTQRSKSGTVLKRVWRDRLGAVIHVVERSAALEHIIAYNGMLAERYVSKTRAVSENS